MLVCDTGVLLAAGNVNDHAHHACLKLLRQASTSLNTLDQRHFNVVRPVHVQSFTLLPGATTF
jgi:predicted nucleic acid-binding protein